MQTAALFAAGPTLGVALAAVLVVTDAVDTASLGDDDLAERAATAAHAGALSLSRP
jgi:hypothetical protein